MKYNNAKTELDGILFDSKKEARRYQELVLLKRLDLIKELELQKKFVLIPKQKGERECSYIADFVYKLPSSGDVVVEDTKGARTQAYIIKRKLMLYVHGIRIKEI